MFLLPTAFPTQRRYLEYVRTVRAHFQGLKPSLHWGKMLGVGLASFFELELWLGLELWRGLVLVFEGRVLAHQAKAPGAWAWIWALP